VELSRLWRWLRAPEPSLDEIAAAEEERRERDAERERAIDEYYEEGFPSQEAVKGFLWFP
jgi:hypothetical protein